jgi:uncharacterized protein (DUF362 family)
MINIYKTDGSNLKEVFEKLFSDFAVPIKGKILIKPNFSGRPPLIPGENTDPEFLKEIVQFLVEKGAEEVIIAHGALLGTADKQFPFDKIIDEGGFAFLREMPKTKLVDLDKEETEIREHEGMKFIFPKFTKDVDFYINLAKLKTHMEATVSFALKNQMGLVAMNTRVYMHKENLEKGIACLGVLSKPNLSIVDGIVAMEGNGPHHGKATNLNTVFAGDNMVELDSVISYLIGIDFNKVKHIVLAEKFGVGKFPTPEKLKEIEKDKFLNFKIAAKVEKFGKNFYVWPTYSCSRCITALNESGKLMKKNPLKHWRLVAKAYLGNKKVNFVIGKADDLEIEKGEEIIAIGNCSKGFAGKCGVQCLDKCPPTVKETIDFIESNIK